MLHPTRRPLTQELIAEADRILAGVGTTREDFDVAHKTASCSAAGRSGRWGPMAFGCCSTTASPTTACGEKMKRCGSPMPSESDSVFESHPSRDSPQEAEVGGFQNKASRLGGQMQTQEKAMARSDRKIEREVRPGEGVLRRAQLLRMIQS